MLKSGSKRVKSRLKGKRIVGVHVQYLLIPDY